MKFTREMVESTHSMNEEIIKNLIYRVEELERIHEHDGVDLDTSHMKVIDDIFIDIDKSFRTVMIIFEQFKLKFEYIQGEIDEIKNILATELPNYTPAFSEERTRLQHYINSLNELENKYNESTSVN